MIRVNLLPPEIKTAAEFKFNPFYVIGGVAVLMVAVLIPVTLMQYSRRKSLAAEKVVLEGDLERLKPVVAKVEELETKRAELNQRKSIIQSLENERLRYPYFMEDFLKLLPSNVWLTSLITTLPADGSSISVSMDITALDHYAVADMVSNLETSQIFADVDIGPISLSGAANSAQAITFHMNTVYRKAATLNALKK